MTWYDILAAIFVVGCFVVGFIVRDVIFGIGNDIIDAPDEDTMYDERWAPKTYDRSNVYDQEKDI